MAVSTPFSRNHDLHHDSQSLSQALSTMLSAEDRVQGCGQWWWISVGAYLMLPPALLWAPVSRPVSTFRWRASLQTNSNLHSSSDDVDVLGPRRIRILLSKLQCSPGSNVELRVPDPWHLRERVRQMAWSCPRC